MRAATCCNGSGERFMERYDAARMERSTRDLVSRASLLEISEGPGHAERRGVDRRLAPRRRRRGAELPRHGEALPRLRTRPRARPVEVGPTTHFMMGGVVIDRVPHAISRALRRGRGRRRRARRQSAGRQRRRGVHRLRRHRGRRMAEGVAAPRARVSRAAAVEAIAGRIHAPLDRGPGEDTLRAPERAARRDVGARGAGARRRRAAPALGEIARHRGGAHRTCRRARRPLRSTSRGTTG